MKDSKAINVEDPTIETGKNIQNYIEDTNYKWTNIKVFHPISVAAGYEVRIQTGQEMLDSGSKSDSY